MPNTTVARRRNALALHRRFLEEAVAAGLPAKGLDQAFAKKIEISPSMWSQIKSSRPIGDNLARQIERHCGVESGWLDKEDRPSEVPDAAEERFIAAAREAWRGANAKGKKELAGWLKKRAQDAAAGGDPAS
ncbi:hypothetical protein ABL840_10805 [Variovorax sp. NFACC27]|uniref:Uncharacterized protein n=1 Tax=Variovorax gossypii TaxID=1679495 RepID=A0A431TNX2_9BURK|nr:MULTISPECIES: hypothetical protein [Variovorax]MDP9605647.1 hypothetical protein [Variovorax paradoxus]SEF33441.1 hypothetical protein SAMN03159371_06452 [Variovorax sp. NFACC28]SEG96387.1 hypothetical protein SAMN03159365_06508 [Variovorax sp. NFACC29]SFD84122.1 hypothetical protein SAMN03159379_06467 [Variovorax sp. NFACC26]SFG95827.1 hypothetical protein SAMN03159447_05810 [Variovorax sp. NFACC27]